MDVNVNVKRVNSWLPLLYLSLSGFILHSPYLLIINYPDSTATYVHNIRQTILFVCRIVLNAIIIALLYYGTATSILDNDTNDTPLIGYTSDVVVCFILLILTTLLWWISYLGMRACEDAGCVINKTQNRYIYRIAYFDVVNYLLNTPGRTHILYICYNVVCITIILVYRIYIYPLYMYWGCYVSSSIVDLVHGYCYVDGVQSTGCDYNLNILYCNSNLQSPLQDRLYLLALHLLLFTFVIYVKQYIDMRV